MKFEVKPKKQARLGQVGIGSKRNLIIYASWKSKPSQSKKSSQAEKTKQKWSYLAFEKMSRRKYVLFIYWSKMCPSKMSPSKMCLSKMSPSKMCPSKMSPSKICPSKMCPPIKCPSIKCPGADILAPDCFPIHPRLLEWSGLVTFCCSCQTAWWIPACCWLGWGSIGDPSKSHYVSVARLSYFWKVLETFSLTKLTQILGNFLYYFTNLSLCIKKCFGSFLGNFG